MTIILDGVSIITMILILFYLLNICLILSGFLVFQQHSSDRRFALTLLRAILFFPLLAAEYLYFFIHFNAQTVPLIIFSEGAFVLLWFCLAHRLYIASSLKYFRPYRLAVFEMLAGLMLIGASIYSLFLPHPTYGDYARNDLSYSFNNPIILFSVFQLIVMLLMILRLEQFWKPLPLVRRWSFKYIVFGCSLVSFAYVAIASSRFLEKRFLPDYLPLVSVILLFVFTSMIYAYARHDLFRLKMLVSELDRPAVSLSVSTLYIALLCFTSLGVYLSGKSAMLVLSCVLAVSGFIAIVCVGLSARMNRAVKHYLSTHFSVKKYEYREAWLDFCNHLQGQISKDGVAEALAMILSRTLYTNHVLIWTGNEKKGFLPTFLGTMKADSVAAFSGNDIIFHYLRTNNYFYVRDDRVDNDWKTLAREKKDFLEQHNLVLLFPLIISDNYVGLIGVGPEFHSGHYGRDDFDLLAALGTQAASALLMVDIAEELASVRERKVWDKFSSFVLHDLKNAANILSLVQENARIHINDPEFQEDMFECIDDALKRMAKVQDRLNLLKGQISPKWQSLDVVDFIRTVVCKRFERSLSGLQIRSILPSQPCVVKTDPEMLFPVLENVILNALEAGGDNAAVTIEVAIRKECVAIVIKDNGPGIEESLLPDKLFEPFKTTKPKGSGIGLWQAKQMVSFLEGEIFAKNSRPSGASFEVRLPLRMA